MTLTLQEIRGQSVCSVSFSVCLRNVFSRLDPCFVLLCRISRRPCCFLASLVQCWFATFLTVSLWWPHWGGVCWVCSGYSSPRPFSWISTVSGDVRDFVKHLPYPIFTYVVSMHISCLCELLLWCFLSDDFLFPSFFLHLSVGIQRWAAIFFSPSMFVYVRVVSLISILFYGL